MESSTLAISTILPQVNASLNATSAVFLLLGFIFIKKGRKTAHRNCMIAALVASTAFLTCYLYKHYTVDQHPFPKEFPTARIVYLSILFPHIVLAVVNLPLIIMTVIAAAKGNFERHKKFAKITFPIWMFVSVTGVIVYFMLYVWFVPSVS